MHAMGLDRLRIATNSGHRQDFDDGPFDGNAFDSTCTFCNCPGNQLSSSLFWSGGER